MNTTATIESETTELERFLAGEPGVYENISMRNYLALDAVGSSTLRTFSRESAAHAKHRAENPEETRAMIIGSATHSLILEPQHFHKEFIVAGQCQATKKNGDRCTNPGKRLVGDEWKCGVHAKEERFDKTYAMVHEQLTGLGFTLSNTSLFGSRYYESSDGRCYRVSDHEPSLAGLIRMRRENRTDLRVDSAAYGNNDDPRTVLTSDEWALCEGMRDAVKAHPKASDFLDDEGVPELTIVWRDPKTDLLCKARIDWYTRDRKCAIDLKSTQCADAPEFERVIFDRGYEMQSAHHLYGAERLGLDIAGFGIIAVESKPHHGCAFYELEPEAIALGFQQCNYYMEKVAKCRESNVWPGYSTEINRIGVPTWAAKRITERMV